MAIPKENLDSPPSFPRIPEIRLDRIVAEGGTGVVFAGRQIYLDRPIAVKVLKPGIDSSRGSFVERFQREAKVLAALDHPHIVACHQAGITEDGEFYLAMDYIDGPDLQRWLEEHGPLPEIKALQVIRNIAGALQYALDHGIIHRDVKPANILLQPCPDGDEVFPFQAKLADLGIARPVQRGPAGLTLATQIIGTPRYMAPEQFGDPDAVDFRIDVYGLGCVLFEMLTGSHPFPGADLGPLILDKNQAKTPDPLALRPELSEGVASLTRRLLDPDKERRPGSYGEVVAICEGLEAGSFAHRAEDRSHTKRRMSPWLTVALCAIAAVLPVARYLGEARTGSRATETPPARDVLSEPPRAVGTPAERRAEIEFEARGEALFSGDFSDPMQGWKASSGQVTWIAEEEGGGINAIGSGQRTRELGPEPWRLEGSLALLTESSKEAGIRIELEPGGAIVLSLMKLDKLYGSFVEIADNDDRPTRRMLSFSPVDGHVQEQVPFSLSVQTDRIGAVLAGRPVGEFPLAGSAHAVTLFVNGATASFRALLLRRPAS